MPERQKVAVALQKLAKQRKTIGFAGEAATAIMATNGAAPALAPLLVRANYGMANQLRVLLSYNAFAQQQGRGLVIVWDKHAACPASFRDLFEPIPRVVVVDKLRELASLRSEWRHLADVPPDAITSTAFTHPSIEATALEASMWEPLYPNAALRAQVDARLATLGDGPFIACHVRRTDHQLGARSHESERTTDEQFYRFVERQPEAWPIFLATDNRVTQDRFLSRYGKRVRALKLIEDVVTPQAMAAAGEVGHHNAQHDAAFRSIDVHRHTPLSDAVVEIFTCVRARVFKGSYYSSFSDAIMRLRAVRGTAAAADEHDLTVPSWHVDFAGVPVDMSLPIDHPKLLAVAVAPSPQEAAEATEALKAECARRRLEALGDVPLDVSDAKPAKIKA